MVDRFILMLAIGIGVMAAPGASSGSLAQSVAIAGYISAIAGRTTECHILRGRRQIPMRYWIDLLMSDQVVAKGTCQVEIMTRDGPRRWVVMGSNSPTVMTTRAQRQALMPKGVEAIGLALNHWNDELLPPIEPPPVPQGKQGKPRVAALKAPASKASAPKTSAPKAAPPPLALPLLSGPVRQKFVAGQRSFNLAWIGGKSPFTLSLGGPGEAAAQVFHTGEDRVVLSTVMPAMGAYEVRLTDAAGASAQGGFDVVAAAPTVTQGPDLAQVPTGIGRILSAMRLAPEEGGAWRMEAHARLLDVARDDYAAALVAGQLAAGKPLPVVSP